MKNTFKIIAFIAATSLILSACGSTTDTTSEAVTTAEATTQSVTEVTEDNEPKTETTKPETTTAESKAVTTTTAKEEQTLHLDYGDAESFEAALNEGETLDGKVVRFVADEYHPESQFGYNIWAGKHLNFISAENIDVNSGDVLTVKVLKVAKLMNSWLISYEPVENAAEDENTMTADKLPEKADETSKKETEAAKDTKTQDEEKSNNTYDKNEYYDIVEVSGWVNSIGDTVIVHKVKAKKNVGISASIIAYAEDGSVIGKSSDDITLTEGEYNYFSYYFDGDISDAKFKYSASAKKDNIMSGERSAVEMEQYDKTEDNLYITFRQVKDEIGPFAKFKLLLYKGDKIVGAEDGYFSTYADNLNGKDSTDVAELWVYGIDFDRVEYIFEP